MSMKLCMDIINANDVSLCTVQIVGENNVTCLKSDKVGSILVPVTMDNNRPGFKLMPLAKHIKVDAKYAGEKLIEADKDLFDAYGTKRNSLMTQKIAWCFAVLNNPGAWVNYSRLEKMQPYEVFDVNDNFFDIATFDAKKGPFILRINNKEEYKSTEFDEFVKKQLRALWQKARDQEQGK